MKRGILVFDQCEQQWGVWIGQQSHWIDQGYTFELRILNRYYKAFLEYDSDWFITLNNDVKFILHTHEVYKIRIDMKDYIEFNLPF